MKGKKCSKGHVERAFAGLPEKMQKVISGYYFESKSLSEIADLSKCSISSLRVNLHKGMHRLRLEFDEEYRKLPGSSKQGTNWTSSPSSHPF
jgi:DNA-directed RNA polymerase specialized sigma24 family protein